MNLLFVNNIPFNPVAGGIERVTDILAKELGRRGYHIFYLCGKLDADSSYLLNYDFPAGLYQLPEEGLFDNKQNQLYYEKLQKDLGIDIVINQRGLNGSFNAILPITTSKLVSVIHSKPDYEITQNLRLMPECSQPPFTSLKKAVKKLFPFVFKRYWGNIYRSELKPKYEKLANYSDAIVTLSHQDICIMNNYISSGNFHKIHSIGNPNSFESPYSENALNKRKIVLFVGRLDNWEKNPLRLLQIWKYLNAGCPDWQLKIVGDGLERCVMEKFVETNKLSNVYFEGQTNNVENYYKEASFICLTSNIEGWGMALTEGMQFGCIPFTFNNYGAASEIIDDGINGCLIPPFKLKTYAKRLSGLMKDNAKRNAMSVATIEKVKRFSVSKIADKWEDLFFLL